MGGVPPERVPRLEKKMEYETENENESESSHSESKMRDSHKNMGRGYLKRRFMKEYAMNLKNQMNQELRQLKKEVIFAYSYVWHLAESMTV